MCRNFALNTKLLMVKVVKDALVKITKIIQFFFYVLLSREKKKIVDKENLLSSKIV